MTEGASIPCAEDGGKDIVEESNKHLDEAFMNLAAPWAEVVGLWINRYRVGRRGVGGRGVGWLFQLWNGRAGTDRLLACGTVLVAGVTFCVIGRVTLVDDGQRVGGLANRGTGGDRLFAGGAILVAGIALCGAGGIALVDGRQRVSGKGLLLMAADVFLTVVAIHTGGVALDGAGGCGGGDVRCVDVVAAADGNCFRLRSAAHRAGVGANAGRAARCRFGYCAAVPGVVRFFNVAAVAGAHALVLGIVELGPRTVAVAELVDLFSITFSTSAGESFYAVGCTGRGGSDFAGIAVIYHIHRYFS